MTEKYRESRPELTALATFASGVALSLIATLNPPFGPTAWVVIGAAVAMALAQVSPWQPVIRFASLRVIAAGTAISVGVSVFAMSFAELVTELPSGYMPDSALVASIGLGLVITGPLLLLFPQRALLARERTSAWRLIAGVPGLLLAIAGGALAQYLGWGWSAPLTALVAVLLGLGFAAGTATVAAALPSRNGLGMPQWAYASGLAINVGAGILVGGSLLAIEFAFSGQLEWADLFFACGAFAAGVIALLLCMFETFGSHHRTNERQAPADKS